jgi:hypothetical protein
LTRDREEVLESYASATVETLEELSPEQRNKLYKILKLRVVLRDDGTPEVSGAFCGDLELPGDEVLHAGNDIPAALSARSRAASMSAVPTPLPCQSSRTAFPGLHACRSRGAVNTSSPRLPTTSPSTQAIRT